MSNIDPKHFLQELHQNIKTRDRIKGQILADNLKKLDPETQAEVISELAGGRDDFSCFMLGYIAANCNITGLRDKIRDAILPTVIQNPNQLISFLNDNTLNDQKIFIELAGDLQLDDAVDLLVGILNVSTDNGSLQATLAALGSIGHPGTVNSIAEYLYVSEKPLVLSAIGALEKIASPSAIQRLAERMGTDSELDIAILDSLAQIQDSLALEKLNDSLRSHHAFLRNHAKSKLEQIGSKAVPILTGNLLYDDPDLLIHSLNVLGLIVDASAAQPIRKLLISEPADANVRFAAYEALGMLPLAKGAFVLTEGLNDQVEHVRIAAARAIEKNFSEIMLAGIKNLLTEGHKQISRIVTAFINAETEDIFLSLLEDDNFRKTALVFLAGAAHPDIRKHYEILLEKNGYSSLAAQLAPGKKKKPAAGRLMVYAVDDSRMILSIYKNTLHKLGYDSMLFEFPAGALDQVKKSKPDILLTDLNMPEITGIDLTREIRKSFPAEELPIIMVTTQSDTPDHEAARAAGVGQILIKPFDEESLGQAISSFFP